MKVGRLFKMIAVTKEMRKLDTENFALGIGVSNSTWLTFGPSPKANVALARRGWEALWGWSLNLCVLLWSFPTFTRFHSMHHDISGGIAIHHRSCNMVSLPSLKHQIAPKNRWLELEYWFPFRMPYFQVPTVSFRECIIQDGTSPFPGMIGVTNVVTAGTTAVGWKGCASRTTDLRG